MKNLKPSNILIGRGNQVKITEAGFQSLFDQKGVKIDAKDKMWMAPEISLGKKNNKNDVWSVGAITLWFMTGKEPSSKEFLADGSLNDECNEFI